LPNVDKLDFRIAISMNTRYMVVVAAMAVMLIGATAFVTDSAFADGKKHYSKNQAISQANACGNGELPLNIGCQNVDSQIQGDENGVSLAADQAFPSFDHGAK
jgi:long-subunit acyl-CoA synthetase (AMP-forming)